MKKVMAEINTLEKTNIEQPKYVEYREYAPLLSLFALLLILTGFFQENVLKVRVP